ncbi:type I DNA topoisomerase [Hirschia maritima]|uniref:type I DNA topoisomerase n=1 Tax=Hirschia maritima TaxID=1121961 RepID=UPI00036065C9|nr:type I DNA topoisomerase [Hirschia maritima]
MQVVVVESPAKAKTINKYLGKDYIVLASYGHIRDLPSKDGSVDPDNEFAMKWEGDTKSNKRVKDIADALKGADGLILATDPDREGEAISWHVLDVLSRKRGLMKDKSVERVVFNAITKKSILEAMDQPRALDQELVDAYLARRALDYLVGFNLSPVLWRKLPGSRSAGRVQSVALRLICEREMEIEAFKPEEYWTVKGLMDSVSNAEFESRLYELNGKKVQKFSLPNKEEADKALEVVRVGGYTVKSVEAKPVKSNPPPPFTTSTLQQEASRKLGFNASRTMGAAQKLYEAGLITYMRTDGVEMAQEAIYAARDAIKERHGAPYVPEKPRVYSSKAKNAQEAHEAVRPTDFMKHPSDLRLDTDLQKLYELVWKRAVASQMATAQLERTTADLKSKDGNAVLRATGQVVKFDGYLTLYQEGKDDAKSEDDNKRLPAMNVGDAINLKKADANQSFTQPPPRFTEASLVKKMEELGIGRPSTYASTLSTLRDRNYVVMEKNRFVPDDKGRLVTIFLENYFRQYVEYDFTAELEEKLDLVSDGKLAWKTFLDEFWKQFKAKIEEVSELRVTNVLDLLNDVLGPKIFPPKIDEKTGEPTGEDPRLCPLCKEGQLSMKLGRNGAFIGCSNYPECRHTRPFTTDGTEAEDAVSPDGKLLGQDPETGKDISLRTGRFGPYVQLGEPVGKEKPKRGSIPKGWSAETLTLEQAIKLINLPREIGPHPEDGEMMYANFGRYGPYVQHLKTYANLPDPMEVFEVGLNRAVALIAEKNAKGGGRGSAAKPIKELGKHPDTDEPINVFDGRYGPYVKHQKTNATLPKDFTPETITLEKAIELINAKEGAKKKKAPAKKKTAAKKKPAAKKATT